MKEIYYYLVKLVHTTHGAQHGETYIREDKLQEYIDTILDAVDEDNRPNMYEVRVLGSYPKDFVLPDWGKTSPTCIIKQ